MIRIRSDGRLQVVPRPPGVSQRTGEEHAELEMSAAVHGVADQDLFLDRRGLVIASALAQQQPEVEKGPPGGRVDLGTLTVGGLGLRGPPQLLEPFTLPLALAAGRYRITWFDTYNGHVITETAVEAGPDGVSLSLSHLVKAPDVACRIEPAPAPR
jgi:hypothetical protein